MKKISLCCFCLSLTLLIGAQPDAPQPAFGLPSLDALYQIADTLDVDTDEPKIRVRWMDSLILVRKPPSKEYLDNTLQKMQAMLEKSGKPPMDADEYFSMMASGAQNCHSYSLQRYFQHHSTLDTLLFTHKGKLFNDDMGIVLRQAFRLDTALSVKVWKKEMPVLDKGLLLVFRSQWQAAIHSLFYDGHFYSKNGAFPAVREESLKPLLKAYPDVAVIEVYRLDPLKIKTFLEKSKP